MSHLSRAVGQTADAAEDHTKELVEALGRRGWGVATAESLTGGTIATVLAAAPSSGDWLRGGVVAYSPEVKFGLLEVPRGSVVTQECARTMAESTARLLGADLCVAVTGVGGPDPDEGEPAGTVWFAVRSPSGVRTQKARFEGSPPEVIVATTQRAIALLREAAQG
ncbi:CinA family protein [Actinotalea sp. K2]|uniref:CinA family protein n=1 Tax=Actinotalea sp. K2 TaxID=2939438 RepID=UPI002017DC70|nr:CinA family protein [Actinotalea sp. K2]MCL3861681.1 CinA family protein [Actinotalea sp. K2]